MLSLFQKLIMISRKKIINFHIYIIFREIREYKSRVESYSREMLRKEAQVRDLTQRLENGEGSKLNFHVIIFSKNRRIIFS